MIGCFTDPYYEELIYSVGARYSEQRRYRTKMAVFQDLFGTNGPVPSIDLPNRLAYLVNSLAPGNCYSVDRLIDEYTLLPFYGVFLPIERVKLVREYMAGSGKMGSSFMVGIGPGSIRPPDYLRFCPVCADEDRRDHGETYWHRLHQLPTVEVCPIHKVWLERTSVPARSQTHQYQFISAEQTVTEIVPTPIDPENFSHQVLLYLAKESTWLLSQRSLSLDPEVMRKRYMVALIQRGLASVRGTMVYLQELTAQFKDRYPEDLLDRVQCKLDQTYHHNWLERLFHRPTMTTHPLYHLMLMHFLGYSVAECIQLPTEYHSFGEPPWPCLNPAADHYRELTVENIDISYGRQGLPRGTFACDCGFIYRRTGPDQTPEDRLRHSGRIKAYGPIWEEELIRLWDKLDGNLDDIAVRLEVSPHVIEYQATRLGLPTVLAKYNPEIADPPKPRRPRMDATAARAKQDRYRAEWLTALSEDCAILGVKFITKHKRIYAWLIRNDPAWLKDHMPRHQQRKSQKPRVDWEQRDRELTDEVRRAAEGFRNKPGRPERITKSIIGQEIGKSRWLYSELDKLPITAAALVDAVDTDATFGVRRVLWAADSFRQEGFRPTYWKLVFRAGVAMIRDVPEIKQAIENALGTL